MTASCSRPTTVQPLMIDLAGTTLDAEDRERLLHPLVGGVILFTRNFQDRAQLTALVQELRALARPPLLIAVDQEGGRVQRFRDQGFTALPAPRGLGELWDEKPALAISLARQFAHVLGFELRRADIDLSFTPVLDLDYGHSGVIGSRALHRSAEGTIALAGAIMAGLSDVGMAHCGKHFPGHGFVRPDSHLALPVDERTLSEIKNDLLPYRRLPLTAVMLAHIVYPVMDNTTAIFSPRWHDFLRHDIGFQGATFTDDLSMKGASIISDMVERSHAAWQAGCDMLVICNDRSAQNQVLEHWQPTVRGDEAASRQRLAALFARPCSTQAINRQGYEQALAALEQLQQFSAKASSTATV